MSDDAAPPRETPSAPGADLCVFREVSAQALRPLLNNTALSRRASLARTATVLRAVKTNIKICPAAHTAAMGEPDRRRSGDRAAAPGLAAGAGALAPRRACAEEAASESSASHSSTTQ